MIALLFAIAICIATPTTENKGLKESNRALQQALEAIMKYEDPNAFLDSIRDSATNDASDKLCFSESVLHELIEDLLFDDTTSESKEVAVGVYTGAQAEKDGKNYIKQAFKNCRNSQCVSQLFYAMVDFKDCFKKAVGCWDYCKSGYTQSIMFGFKNTKNEKIARANQHVYCKQYLGGEHGLGDGSPQYIVAPLWLQNKEWPTF